MRTLGGIRWDLLTIPIVGLLVLSCTEASEDRGSVSAPETEMELTALAICEDWKPYDPEWVEFCEEVRRQAMLLLEQEDPLCAQYAQDLLNADAVGVGALVLRAYWR